MSADSAGDASFLERSMAYGTDSVPCSLLYDCDVCRQLPNRSPPQIETEKKDDTEKQESRRGGRLSINSRITRSLGTLASYPRRALLRLAV